MSQVKQVGLLAAGCQPWNKDVCAASGDRFAYCATLAIYVYQVRFIFHARLLALKYFFFVSQLPFIPLKKCSHNNFEVLL